MVAEQAACLREWAKVIRRLQSVARGQGGCAVLTIKVVVDCDGNPIFWRDPTRVLLEPRARVTKEMLDRLAEMCGDNDKEIVLSVLLDLID